MLHFQHILGKVILARKSIHAWKMIDLLMGLHLAQHLDTDCGIGPLDVPIFRLFFADDVVVQLPADFFHHIVLGVYEIGGYCL